MKLTAPGSVTESHGIPFSFRLRETPFTKAKVFVHQELNKKDMHTWFV